MKNSGKNNILDIPDVSFFELCQGKYKNNKLFIFDDGNEEPKFLTGEILAQKSKAVGEVLQYKLATQERVLIILPQSLEYISSLLGCFYANVVAVPIPVTDTLNSEQVIAKVEAIAKDADAKCIITNEQLSEFFNSQPQFKSLTIINVFNLEKLEKKSKKRTQLEDDLAILLYTSGSTSQPKGVMISHGNLKTRAAISVKQWKVDEKSCIVSWLPQFHSFAQDLNIFVPLLKGATSVIQSPSSFIHAPHKWFKAIDGYKATHTGIPNFAFDYSTQSVNNEDLKGDSLKSLQIILSGGDPVRLDSCEKFYNKFSKFGLKRNIISQIYGLSEMGTVVTHNSGEPFQLLSLNIQSLKKGQVKKSGQAKVAKEMISCGKITEEVEIKIVNPESLISCKANEIGEVWVKSAAIGKGYYKQDAETKKNFGVNINKGKEAYLRTGDLGFIKDNYLYLVGREKEVMIIRGKNFHPVDMEYTLKKEVSKINLPTAVFSKEIDQEENIIVVQEIESGLKHQDHKEIASEIISTISLTYQIEVYDIVFVTKDSIPKTGSGKISRKSCSLKYENQQLNIIYSSATSNAVEYTEVKEIYTEVNPKIFETLKRKVFSSVLDISSENFDAAKTFNELGLNSMQYIKIAKRIEEIFNIEFNPVMLFEYKDITSLTQYLTNKTNTAEDAKLQESDAPNSKNSSHENKDEVAVVGVSCCLPGEATNKQTFWNNIIEQKDCITPVSDRKQLVSEYERTRLNSEDSLPKWGGFINNYDTFDAPFFNISTLEAESMDPQQRKAMELTWSVIEDGGYNPRNLSGLNVGLYFGVHTNDYSELVARQPDLMDTYGAFLDSGLHMSMIANRVSRWLDFHGPSEVINTACSSSLIAVHHAVDAIQKGKCDVAIAGGINLILASRVSCAANKGGMLAPDGRCKTFDEAANGFVRAEGYGAVMLKPLSQAKADGDIIYGVIKGAAVNHDGHSNSLRAPNLVAQKELVKAAYKKANISASTVSYIEAHGTGTALGDPIEIQALKDAFQEMGVDNKQENCAISSIKTNIGHCESAAGIAGLVKILLAIKHKTIPGILHFNKLNPYISLKNTPFYIADKHYAWDNLKTEKGEDLPLRAAISSFGFGGSNAHVIVEEYVSDCKKINQNIASKTGKAIIVLSAKNSNRLNAQAAQLLNYINENQFTDSDLLNLAYTLQTGREEMGERLGFAVSSIQELKDKLQNFIDADESATELYTGKVSTNNDSVASLIEDEDIVLAIGTWLEKGKYGKFLELWVKGMSFDWEQLYKDLQPQKISLPTYPFAQERYWIPESDTYTIINKSTPSNLHPLVHQNTSNFKEQCFTSVFSGQEFFLNDHKVKTPDGKTQKILPGVSYLEMVQFAVKQALADNGNESTIEVKQTVWIQPIIVDAETEVTISLFPSETDNEVEFEVYTWKDNTKVLHCEGQAALKPKSDAIELNIQALKSNANSVIESTTLYSKLNSLGLHYGSGHQAVGSVFLGKNVLIAELKLPEVVEHDFDNYQLHPSLLDSALQTTLCLTYDLNEDLGTNPPMPFSLQALKVLSGCTKNMFAYVRFSADSEPGSEINRFDIDMTDAEGNICVQMTGFSSKVKTSGSKIKQNNAQNAQHEQTSLSEVNSPYFSPVWNPVVLANQEPVNLNKASKILLLGKNDKLVKGFKQAFSNSYFKTLSANASINEIANLLKESSFDQIVWIAPEESKAKGSIINDQEEGVLQLFRIIKALVSLKYNEQDVQLTCITENTQQVLNSDKVSPSHAGVHGLLGSLAKEYVHWKVRLLDVDSISNIDAKSCLELPFSENGNGLAYRKGEWFAQELANIEELPKSSTAYKQNGVYVVIGGSGGVGAVWSQYMIENYQAKIVWIGRQKINNTIQEKIDNLSQFGEAPMYISADAINYEALNKAYKQIQKKYSEINGVVHSAIVLQDQSLTQMDEEKFIASLAPKVNIGANMHQVFGKLDLDFMLFLSSLIAFTKSAGQANYAAGSTFTDSFALSLNNQSKYPVKTINWGYWGDFGIVKDESYKKRMMQQGIGSIEPKEGMDALEILMGSDMSQLVFHKTLKPKSINNAHVSELQNHYSALTAFDLNKAIENLDQQVFSKRNKTLQTGEFSKEAEQLAMEILATNLDSLGALKSESSDKIKPLYKRWLESSIAYLEQEKGVKSNKLSSKIKDIDELWSAWEKKKPEWLANPNWKAHVILLEACLKALPKILKGELPGTDVMFPNSSMELVEGIYKNNISSDYYNEVLAETLKVCIIKHQEEKKSRKLRILEIGAGTGGTTAKLLPILKEYENVIQQYCYTDLSKAFLQHATDNYQPEFPALTTAIFDVSKPLAGQSIETNNYDFVIATNVLHATPNIRNTMRNAKAVLKNKGVMLINEISNWSLFTHLTFGLLDGWWLYEDSALRLSGSPGLLPEQWNEVLTQEGFEAVAFVDEPAHKYGQQIIAACSNGIVRQAISEKVDTENITSIKVDETKAAAIKDVDSSENGANLRERAITYFQGVVGETLRMEPANIVPDKQLSEFGLDSILVVQLTNKLRKSFTDITSTLFFEVQTLDALVDYFIENKSEALSSVLPAAKVEEKQEFIPAEQISKVASSDRPNRLSRLPKQKLDINSTDKAEHSIFDVAIIGLNGRYPQSENLDAFWKNLSNGKNCISEIPKDRWNWEDYYDAEKGKKGKLYSKWGGFLTDIDKFDPLFFKISPKEAKQIDPQERLFLESCYHAIEDAGYTPQNLGTKEKIGVFAGVMNSRYTTQPAHYSIANRISYLFDYQGPSMAVDTACSSSLSAIHTALESMYSGLTNCAIAGGVNLIIDPEHYLTLSGMTMLSAGKDCKAFGDNADGFVDAEGVGVVILKPLKQAEKDGDHIYGVIKASAVNAGGKTNGYTVPNPKAQSAVVSNALDRAGLKAEQISYIEAHGTGTALGDPIEIAGLTKVFKNGTSNMQSCSIGSVKSNIGHCESAAGIAGLTKILLQFKHKKLVPSINADTPNPEIDFSHTPFKVQKSLEDWNKPEININNQVVEIPRIAGVSSFGAGGANAHVLIQEYAKESNEIAHPINESVLIPISARTSGQLKQKVIDLHACLTKESIALSEVAYTLQAGRVAMKERVAFQVSSMDQLLEKLNAFLNGDSQTEGLYQGQVDLNFDKSGILEEMGITNQDVNDWLNTNNYSELAKVWVSGFDFDWNQMYSEQKPRRVSLPTYPFARERYWNEPQRALKSDAANAIVSKIHPLVHTNTSDLSLQKYSSVFSARSLPLSNNLAKNNETDLPALALVEMAFVAVQNATPSNNGNVNKLNLQNINFGDTVTVLDNKQVDIALFAEENDQVGFEIYSEENGNEQIHCQGISAIVSDIQQNPQFNSSNIDRSNYYRTNISLSNNSGENKNLIYPILTESLQQIASKLLGSSIENKENTLIPNSIDSVSILDTVSENMIAYGKYSESHNVNNSNIKLDIDLCNSQGDLCAQLMGVTYKSASATENEKVLELNNIQQEQKQILDQNKEEVTAELEDLVKPSKISFDEPDVLNIEENDSVSDSQSSVTLLNID